jgi:1,4-dihydroxy-2-naphthoyl-CoA hydrolase
MDLVSTWQRYLDEQPLFASYLGIRLLSITPEEIVGELDVRPELGQPHGIAHGGVLMAFADSLGGLGASVNLPPGMATTTLESKTNFMAAAPVGGTITGRAERLHGGRRTTVWQTRITNADGRLLAQVTQTQMVIEPRSA